MRKFVIRYPGYETRIVLKTMLFSLFCFVTLSLCSQSQSIPISSLDKSGDVVTNVEEGEITLHVLDMESGSTHIQYEYQKASLPNPFTVSHDYYINTLADGRLSVDVDAFMDPLDLYFDKSVKMSSEGVRVLFPSSITSNTKISDVSCHYTMTIANVENFNRTYDVSLENMIVGDRVSIAINGKTYNGHALSYDLNNTIKFNGDILMTKSHHVNGVFISELGFIQNKRIGVDETEGKNIERNSLSAYSIK